jgi:hypothetical protein
LEALISYQLGEACSSDDVLHSMINMLSAIELRTQIAKVCTKTICESELIIRDVIQFIGFL